jgi:hypothetical protein
MLGTKPIINGESGLPGLSSIAPTIVAPILSLSTPIAGPTISGCLIWNLSLPVRLAGAAAPTSGRCSNIALGNGWIENAPGGTRNPVKLFREGPATKHGAKPTKPFSQLGEDTQKRIGALIIPDPTTGCDHVGPHSQRDLSPVPSSRPSRHLQPGGKAMTEAVTATCIFFSISVFLAHAFDAYRMR